MSSYEHSYIFLLPDDVKVKIIKEMDLEEFILFLNTYPQMVENEYYMDILKHFYLEYELPICNTFDELVAYFNLDDTNRLKITVVRDDIQDFNRIISEMLDSDQVNYLLKSCVSPEMTRIVLDNTDEYTLYMPILKSQNTDLIRYLLDKMGENDIPLYSEYDIIIDLAKSTSIDNKNDIAIDIISEYHPDGYTDAIVGFIEGYNEGNILCKEFARKYILGDYHYEIETIFEGLEYPESDFEKIKDELEDMDNDDVKHYLTRKFGLE